MRLFVCLAFTAAALTVALPCAAAGPWTPARRPGPVFHAYAAVDLDIFNASQTFDAVVGSSHLPAYGGGVDVTDIWKHLFIRVAVTHLSKKGGRVFVDSGQVFPLGIPLTLTMTPIEIGGGWRFAGKRPSRFAPYAGGAALIVPYKETSAFGDAADNVSQSFTGAAVFAGVEASVTRSITVGGEAQFRAIPNALGTAGASQAYNETDLGGVTARVTIGVKLGR
ncbi:MAG TPA: hypothetical protein VL225_01020 [Vicinamibacterales bacterium]|nr:hypothetical protein [Vicinamibacterales bacterium]